MASALNAQRPFARRGGQYRNWCLTLNNFTPAETISWTALGDAGEARVQYFVFQEEVGGAPNHTPHYQAYVEFKRATRMRTVKGIFGNTVHCERRAGSQAVAIAYCKKDDTRVDGGLAREFGQPKASRGRPKGNFGKVAHAIRDQSKSLDDLEDEFPETFAMFADKLNDYHLAQLGERDWEMEIEIYVGPSGSGKSTTAKLENPGAYHCPWPTGGRWWWPNYRGQEVVILDEWRHDVKIQVLLKLFDRHTFHLEAKGRNFQFVSHKIVLTTNIEPRDWFPGTKFDVLDPLQRRIREYAKIYDFAGGHQFPNFVKTLRPQQFTFNARPWLDAPAYGG